MRNFDLWKRATTEINVIATTYYELAIKYRNAKYPTKTTKERSRRYQQFAERMIELNEKITKIFLEED